ncbi:MAG: HTH domain-containing protein [Bacteroidota bacterium]
MVIYEGRYWINQMTFLELAERILREEQKPLTSTEIWIRAEEKGYTSLLNTSGKTPWATLAAQIYVNERDNSDTPFGVIGKRPKRFYLKQQESLLDLDKIETEEKSEEIIKKKSKRYLEKDLHPFLAHFAFFVLKSYTKTINHSKSNKKEYGEWVHPDMVGCVFPIGDWSQEVLQLSSTVGNNAIKVISFELKRELTLGKLRENFFQTVSNSSWANEGYLVAAEISDNEDFRNELSRLSASFGIGVIRLDIEEPFSSEIILPAKTKEFLDWDTINKLTMNKDFREFLRRIKNDLTSSEIRSEAYDKILESEELVKSIQKRK